LGPGTVLVAAEPPIDLDAAGARAVRRGPPRSRPPCARGAAAARRAQRAQHAADEEVLV
jgi:hypothetical protein